jgi:D-alanyl-D-alanine carboxypeptidase/D-alanyl-D-alanine-endopeptidase (penicillin-binding protein 4)
VLRISPNLHTVAWPYVIGATQDPRNPVTAYKALRSRLYAQAGLDPNPPGEADGRYTPDFFVKFLSHIRQQPYFPQYRSALPIMGKDGSLAGVQVNSPAAGHVHAKTGTGFTMTPSPAVHKALAGYVTPRDGRPVVFAQFMTMPATPDNAMGVAEKAGEAMGEIATAVYQAVSR